MRDRDPARETWDGRRAGPEGAVRDFGADHAFPISDIDEILPGPTVHDPVQQVIATEELESLVSCLSGAGGGLPDLESRVLSLYLDGHSYEATAERLECDTKTVDNALQRVKRKVGAHLESREVPL